MKNDLFKVYKMAITFIVAAGISVSITIGNWYLPGILIISAALAFWALKRKVVDITEDERDRKVAGKAALMAMTIYTLASAVVGTTFVALGKDNVIFYSIGSALLYGPSLFIVLYSLLFKFYVRKQDQD